MSGIKSPEAGDVWKNKYGEEANIIYSGWLIVFVRKYWITSYEYHYEIAKCELTKFLKNYIYIGKSKASIKDLFCVKENTKNDTQTDLHNIDDTQAEETLNGESEEFN